MNSIYCSAQKYSPYQRLYTFDIGMKDMSCDLYFEGNNYYMTLTDMVEIGEGLKNLILSYGTFDNKGDAIVMKDEEYGFVMSFKKDGENLKAVTSFHFLTGNSFTKCSDDFFDTGGVEIVKFDVSLHEMEKDIISYNKKHRKEIPLRHGLYKTRSDAFWPYSLEILDNGGYLFYYNGLCLSTGVITRERNILVLHDIYLAYPFRAFIGDGKITSCSLPTCLGTDEQLLLQKE